MEKIPVIEIRLSHADHLSELQKQELSNVLEDAYGKVMHSLQERKFWCNDVEKIIVTNNYQSDIVAQAKEWGIPVSLSANKEYIGISKALYNLDPENPKWHLFFPLILLPSNPDWMASVLIIYLTPYSQLILPESLHPYLGRRLPASGFKNFVSLAVSGLCPAMYTRRLLKLVLDKKMEIVDDQALFNLFARKLKKGLYDYNATPDNDHLWALWESVYSGMYNLLLRCIDIYTRDGMVSFEDQTLNEIVNRILSEVDNITTCFVENKECTYELFEQGLIDFLGHFRVEIRDTDMMDAMHIHLDKNPKDYFRNLLVETEPRFVCFMDILGFSQMIEDYENNDLSTVLQDIQKAFKKAISVLNFQANDEKSQEFLQYLEYKTFSDNICISLPYFDNETDFLANFNLMITFVRGLQYALMTLGFFTRGGLTIGSYYSDQNMIFSKGLVDAYLLETKKAVYPRIIISDKIISKISGYNSVSVKFYNLEGAIIIDKGLHCVNPFLFLTDTTQMIASLFNPELYGVDNDDPLSIMLKNITSNLGGLLQRQLMETVPDDEVQMQTIIDHVLERKERFRNDRRTLAKYLWVELLTKWKGDKTDSKRFSYFSMPKKTAKKNQMV